MKLLPVDHHPDATHDAAARCRFCGCSSDLVWDRVLRVFRCAVVCPEVRT